MICDGCKCEINGISTTIIDPDIIQLEFHNIDCLLLWAKETIKKETKPENAKKKGGRR
jgi:hypothetical protein